MIGYIWVKNKGYISVDTSEKGTDAGIIADELDNAA